MLAGEYDAPLAVGALQAVVIAAAAATLAVAAVLSTLALRRRQRAAEPEVEAHGRPHADRELESVRALSDSLVRATDVEAVGRLLVNEVQALLPVEFSALALVNDEAREALGLTAVLDGRELDWFREVRIDLDTEPSAIASAAFEAAPLAIYDVRSAPNVNRRLADRVGAKSAAFVPLVAGEHVVGVVVAATTSKPHAFTHEELALVQALAAEAALALERTRSASALARALERERLVGDIGRKVRSELDLDAVLRVAVEETAKAVGVSRCFIRMGEPGADMPIVAEWLADGVATIGEAGPRLPVSNLTARERRTVAADDILASEELADPELGGVQTLVDLGTRAVLATPIVVFDRVIGVFGLHRPEPTQWGHDELALAEAVAREVGLAIHTARLLDKNERQLQQQAALLMASQVVTSELRLETVLQRLVVELTKLVGADAADCYLYDADRHVLACAAVHGLDPGLVRFEFPADRGLSGEALRRGESVRSQDYAAIHDRVPHAAYEGFQSSMVAPMKWSGETRGVLGVGSRDPAGGFTEGDADLLEAYAGLAALALRNAESFEQSARQARIQRGFYGIASVLGEPLSLAETLDALTKAANEAMGGSYAAVLLPAPGGLELAAGHDLPPSLEDVLREGISDAAFVGSARDRRVLAASAVLGDERFGSGWQQLAREVGFRSLVAIPVEFPRQERTGVALVFLDEERPFSDDELELAHHLAGAARGALERSELFEKERRSRALAQQLARMSSLLATELDPAAILDDVAEQAPALVDADACSVSVLDGDELVFTAAAGAGAEAALGERVASTAWLAGDVAQTRAPVVVSDVARDERLRAVDPILSGGLRAYLGVPLLGAEGGLFGVLAVYATEPRTWREEEVEALAALAGNASAVLANAELYQRVALERERSLAILSNIADGIVAVDRDGEVVLWNAAAERITGVPASEALGRTPAQVLQRGLEATAEGGDRLVPIRRGGEEVWLSVSEAVMRDPAGAVAGRIFAFRDVSSERVVEELKSEFVSTVSHELRSPLTSIYGFAETLLRQDVLFGDEERRTFVGYIASEAQRLTSIVDALLNVARLDAGDLKIQPSPTDLRQVVSEVVNGAEAAGGQRLVLDLPEEPLDAVADRDKVRQVLVQLVDNALKFSPDGGTVTVAGRRKADAVEVRVDDQGTGVPPAERERIFRKFYRGDTAREGSGTGLGLFIARGLVLAMGGRIWVDDAEGSGASFTVELPLAPGNGESQPPREREYVAESER